MKNSTSPNKATIDKRSEYLVNVASPKGKFPCTSVENISKVYG